MATAAENIAILLRYFDTGGDFGPIANASSAHERAMREILWDGGGFLGPTNPNARATRAAFAKAQIFENTLSPPSLVPDAFVRPSLQLALFDGLHKIGVGGFWTSGDPAGLTPWLGTEGGSRYALEAALTDPPRTPPGGGPSIELAPEVIAALLRLLRDVALPVSWLAPLGRSDMFKRLEVRAASSTWPTSIRRMVLALVGQAQGRISTALAQIAAGSATFPSFPTGDGASVATTQPQPRPWYRQGLPWIGIAAGVVGGGAVASRLRR